MPPYSSAAEGKRRWATHVFTDNLLDGRRQTIPLKHFEILFDIPRFRIAETHDCAKEILRARFSLGASLRFEPFQIPPDPILFFNRKPLSNDRFEEINDIDRGDETRILVVSENARDNDGILLEGVLFKRDGSESHKDL